MLRLVRGSLAPRARVGRALSPARTPIEIA